MADTGDEMRTEGMLTVVQLADCANSQTEVARANPLIPIRPREFSVVLNLTSWSRSTKTNRPSRFAAASTGTTDTRASSPLPRGRCASSPRSGRSEPDGSGAVQAVRRRADGLE